MVVFAVAAATHPSIYVIQQTPFVTWSVDVEMLPSPSDSLFCRLSEPGGSIRSLITERVVPGKIVFCVDEAFALVGLYVKYINPFWRSQPFFANCEGWFSAFEVGLHDVGTQFRTLHSLRSSKSRFLASLSSHSAIHWRDTRWLLNM